MWSIRVCVALLLVRSASGHGWVTEPPARNAVSGEKNGYCPHCGNGNGICGDGGQWPSGSNYVNAGGTPVRRVSGQQFGSRLAMTSDLVSDHVRRSGPHSTRTWTAGAIHEVVINITAHHKGHFEFSICDEEITSSLSNAQSWECQGFQCLFNPSPFQQELGLNDCQPNDRRAGCQPLDTRHPERFYLPPSGFSPDNNNGHVISLKVPSGLQCSRCTLQWRWWSANSCTPASDYGCYAEVLDQNGYNSADWFQNLPACPGGGLLPIR
eukprot:g4366.t1